MIGKPLAPGTKVDHDGYGEGIVAKDNLTNYEIFFVKAGKMIISKNTDEMTVVEEVKTDTENTGNLLDEMVNVLSLILDKYASLSEIVHLGDKWTGGKMILQPANKDLKPKEIPIEVFFHKIVMLRDRLRVLEQNINSHAMLSDEEKVNLQQYITRIYGSLTTFNVLFADKNQYFKGASQD